MKTKLVIFTLALTAWGQAVSNAATLTIDVPAADVPRVQEAFGSILNLGRPATQAEIEAAMKQSMINQTKDYERRKNMAQFTPPPMEMQPSPTPAPTAFKAAPTATPKKK